MADRKGYKPLIIVIYMLAASLFLKFLVYLNHWQLTSYERYTMFANIFIMLTGVFFAIRHYKLSRSGEISSFADDFKAGMRVAALYTLAMTAFVFIYYNYIDPNYFPEKLNTQLQLAEASGLDTRQVEQTGSVVLTPFFQSTVTLIGFMIMGMIYSALIAFLVRKVKGFGHLI
jgi:hypothetical protein